MSQITQTSDLEPAFVSVKEAARYLALSPWSVYKLLDAQEIESRYHGRKRLVVVASMKSYAAGLSATAPESA